MRSRMRYQRETGFCQDALCGVTSFSALMRQYLENVADQRFIQKGFPETQVLPRTILFAEARIVAAEAINFFEKRGSSTLKGSFVQLSAVIFAGAF